MMAMTASAATDQPRSIAAAHQLRGLIFDVDGTLAETEEAHRAAFNQTFADFGLPWTWSRELYRDLLKVAGGKERIRSYIGRERLMAAMLTRDMDGLIAKLHQHKTTLYTRAVAAGGVPFRPGIVAVVEEARARGLKLSIATTTSRANVEALFEGSKGEMELSWFGVVKCAEDAPAKKPDPQVYLAALADLGLRASECLAFEDSRNGLRAARAAGIPTLITESVYTRGDDFPGALSVRTDLLDVGLEALTTLWLESRADNRPN